MRVPSGDQSGSPSQPELATHGASSGEVTRLVEHGPTLFAPWRPRQPGRARTDIPVSHLGRGRDTPGRTRTCDPPLRRRQGVATTRPRIPLYRLSRAFALRATTTLMPSDARR